LLSLFSLSAVQSTATKARAGISHPNPLAQDLGGAFLHNRKEKGMYATFPFLFYFRSRPLDVCQYAFGAQTKISAKNPLAQGGFVGKWGGAFGDNRKRKREVWIFSYFSLLFI